MALLSPSDQREAMQHRGGTPRAVRDPESRPSFSFFSDEVISLKSPSWNEFTGVKGRVRGVGVPLTGRAAWKWRAQTVPLEKSLLPSEADPWRL